jgi:hypothetical protein
VSVEAHAMAVLLETTLFYAALQDDLAFRQLPPFLLETFLAQLSSFCLTWADWVPYTYGPGEELIVQ